MSHLFISSLKLLLVVYLVFFVIYIRYDIKCVILVCLLIYWFNSKKNSWFTPRSLWNRRWKELRLRVLRIYFSRCPNLVLKNFKEVWELITVYQNTRLASMSFEEEVKSTLFMMYPRNFGLDGIIAFSSNRGQSLKRILLLPLT